MRTFSAFLVAAVILPAGPIGCGRPHPSPWHSALPLPADISLHDRDRLWAAAEQSLRDRGYELDRLDRASGVMTTRPVVSQQFFEIWRRDVATWRDWVEASLNVVRRWVDVRIRADDSVPRLEVIVYKQRITSPDRQFNNSGAAYRIFTGTLPTTSGESGLRPEQVHWIDLGRDGALEAELAAEIAARGGIGVPVPDPVGPRDPT